MPLSDQDILDIAGLIHSAWSDSYELMKLALAETDDGSPDWQEFHQVRCGNARATEAKWMGVKNRFTDEHRATLTRAFGL